MKLELIRRVKCKKWDLLYVKITVLWFFKGTCTFYGRDQKWWDLATGRKMKGRFLHDITKLYYQDEINIRANKATAEVIDNYQLHKEIEELTKG